MLILEVEINAEGSKLAYLSKEGAGVGRRIAGPKAWGGSKNIARLKVNERDIAQFIRDESPEIIEMLKAQSTD